MATIFRIVPYAWEGLIDMEGMVLLYFAATVRQRRVFFSFFQHKTLFLLILHTVSPVLQGGLFKIPGLAAGYPMAAVMVVKHQVV